MFPCTHTLRCYLQSDGTYQDFTGNHEITSKRKSRGSYLIWHPLISRCCMIRLIQRLLEEVDLVQGCVIIYVKLAEFSIAMVST